jgi:hypothetical protein
MLAAYFLLPWAFWLGILGIASYIGFLIYGKVRWHMTPHGKRISHRRMKGYFTQKYGSSEGTSIYKHTVAAMRKKGYR